MGNLNNRHTPPPPSADCREFWARWAAVRRYLAERSDDRTRKRATLSSNYRPSRVDVAHARGRRPLARGEWPIWVYRDLMEAQLYAISQVVSPPYELDAHDGYVFSRASLERCRDTNSTPVVETRVGEGVLSGSRVTVTRHADGGFTLADVVDAPRCTCGSVSVYPIRHASDCPVYLHYFDPPARTT